MNSYADFSPPVERGEKLFEPSVVCSSRGNYFVSVISLPRSGAGHICALHEPHRSRVKAKIPQTKCHLPTRETFLVISSTFLPKL